MEDAIKIGIFSHAANGGIEIDENAFTGVPGLYAAGEVAGGMHGADRIGGLSTANGLVFGKKAGISAVQNSQDSVLVPKECEFLPVLAKDADSAFKTLQQTMFQYAMILRNEEGLNTALQRIRELEKEIIFTKKPRQDAPRQIAAAKRLQGQLQTARCIVQAALLRRESRGSHYREDYPALKEEMTRWIRSRKVGEVKTEFVTAEVK